MSFDKTLMSRIGTCRSGRLFDVPYDLEETQMNIFLSNFVIDDLIDIFCRCEAHIVGIMKSEPLISEQNSIVLLDAYFWKKDIFHALKPNLERLGLQTSPDYVRFGQSLLLS